MKSTAVSQQQSRLRCAGGECGQVSVELKLNNLAFSRGPIVSNMAITKDNVPLYACGHDLLLNGRMINPIPHIGSCLCIIPCYTRPAGTTKFRSRQTRLLNIPSE